MKKDFRKHWKTSKHTYWLWMAICTDLIEFLPHITFARQTNELAYGGKHCYIEIGWLIFHAKIRWEIK